MTIPHNFSCALRCAIFGATTAWFSLLSPLSFAEPSCRFNTVTGVNFGEYDVFAAGPNNNGVGTLSIHCQGGGGPTFVVSLSAGQSHGYTSRQMRSGGNWLNYNLYTSAARTVVWGDGTGGSGTKSVAMNADVTLSVFGQIPAGQDAAVGTYIDSITTTVNF